MNMKKCLPALAAITTIFFSVTIHAAPDKKADPKKSVATANVQKGELKAERNGAKVTLTWTLPAGDWKNIDIIRNDKAERKNAPRVKTVRPSPAAYVDEVPDAGATYWYWLKVYSAVDNKAVQVGPVVVK